MNLGIFLFICFFQIFLTIGNFIKTCKSNSLFTWAIYLIHNVSDVFLFWSFLFLSSKLEFGIHLFCLIILVIHWFLNNNKCILNTIMNKECGYSDEQWLESLKNMLGLRSHYEHFQFIWLGLLAAQDVYKLLN